MTLDPSKVVGVSGQRLPGHAGEHVGTFNAVRAALCEVGRFDLAVRIQGGTSGNTPTPHIDLRYRDDWVPEPDDQAVIDRAVTVALAGGDRLPGG